MCAAGGGINQPFVFALYSTGPLLHEFTVSSSAQSARKCGLCDLVTALADHGLPNLNARAAQRVCVALGVGSALSVPSRERAGLTSSVFPSRHSARTLAGSDVACPTPLCTLH